MQGIRMALVVVGTLTALAKSAVGSASPEIVDLNRATVEELLAFPGIGRLYAHKVIAARPFRSRSELVTRNVMPAPVYVALKHLLFVSGENTSSRVVNLGPVGAGLVDLNRASVDELAAVPGIGRQYARSIAAARPFRSEIELVGRRIMPLTVFRSVEGRIGVGH